MFLEDLKTINLYTSVQIVGLDIMLLLRGGVSIFEGCTIGASAVVTKDIPPFSLAAGNPAIVKKHYDVPEGYYD